MAGWKTNDMLSGLPGILNLAAAGGTDLAVASDIVTDGLTGLGLTANDSSKFVDIMAATITNANTNVEMMGETLKYAGPVAGSLGIKMEDLSLAIGLMGNAGIKSSQAGTALRGGLTNLVKPTDNMEAAMKKYGVSIKKTSDGSVDFMATIKLLRDKLGGLEETTQANVLATIFGKEAMSGWAAVVNASEADFNKLNTAISNSEGKAKELAEVMQQNLGGSIDNMKSALEGALKDGFEAMLPVLEKVVKSITNVAKWFSSLDEEAQRNIVTMAGIAAAIGPLLIAVGQLIVVGGNAVTLFGKLSTAGGKTAKVVGLLKNGFKLLGGTTGIGAAILAVTVAVKAFKELDKQMQKETIPSINSVIDNMSNLSDETKDAVKPFLELGQTVETEFMKMNASGVVMTSEMKTSVIKNLDEMTSGVSESITKSKDEAVKGLESMFNATVSITEEEKIQIVEKTKEAYDSKVETITNSKDKINEILNIALSENRELNIEEENQIRTHYKNIKDISLESMISSKEELLAIKKELNIHSKELSAQQASDVIKEATKQRDESVEAAKNEYEKRLEYASILRAEGGKENEALAKKVIEEAKRMKNEQITQANLAADSVIASARTQAGEYVKNIDYMTGEVLNGWDKLNFDLIEMMSNFTNSILESSQDLGAGTQILFNQMKVGLLDFVLSSIEWWRELPFTDSDAFNGIYENCKKSLDETKNYIDAKNKEIEELSLFRSLPGKVKDNMTKVQDVLESHFKVPMEQLLFDTQIWSNMTADEFYKLPQEVQQALRSIDQSLVETGENGLGAFLSKSQMMADGVIFSFDQLDKDTQLTMSNVEQSLMDLNGINLEQFVLQCVTAADGGKTAFEDLPQGVKGSINEINNQLVNRHGLTLEQFILNTKKATGEYKEAIDKDTKEAAQNADKNTKELENKVDTNTKGAKEKGNKNTKGLEINIDTNTKNAKDKADKNTKDLSNNTDKNTKDASNKADTNTKDLAKKVDTNTKDANNKAKSNMDKAAKDVGTATSNMAKEAKKGTGEVAKNTDSDMKKANKSVQQSATDMYNGSKKSYSKMADVARDEGTRMYKGVTTSAQKMSDKARSSATEMYKGVTTSTSRMADKAISDWNRIRNAYSKPISGTVTKTTVNKTIARGEGNTRSVIYDDIAMINNIRTAPRLKVPDISDFDISGRYYNITSTDTTPLIKSKMEKENLLKDIKDIFSKHNNISDDESNVVVNIYNPKISSENDMKKIVEVINKELYKIQIRSRKSKGVIT